MALRYQSQQGDNKNTNAHSQKSRKEYKWEKKPGKC